MNMITYFNELVTKNFNNYLKNYFNNINFAEKNGNFLNYYNFMHDLDSFNNSFIKDVIKSYFEYIDECFFNSSYRKTFVNQMVFTKEKIMLLYLVKLILKEDIIMIRIQKNTFSLLTYF